MARVTVTATASDDVGVTSVQFLVDGAALGAADTDGAVRGGVGDRPPTNGAHTLTAVARDAAGHETTASTVSVTVMNDTTAPTVARDESGRRRDSRRQRHRDARRRRMTSA